MGEGFRHPASLISDGHHAPKITGRKTPNPVHPNHANFENGGKTCYAWMAVGEEEFLEVGTFGRSGEEEGRR
jgi:hypothetical protein